VTAEVEIYVTSANSGQRAGFTFGVGNGAVIMVLNGNTTQTTGVYAENAGTTAGPTWTLAAPINHGTWITLRVRRNGRVGTAWINGVLMGTFDCGGTAVFDCSKIAFYTYQVDAAFRNLKVWSPPAIPTYGGGSSAPSIDNLSDFNTVFGSTYTGHDQEFNTLNSSALPSGWTWQNQGTSTYRERFGAGTLVHQGDAQWRSIVKSLTGAPATWDVYMKIGVSVNRSGNTEWGLLLTDGTVHRIFERLTTTGADQSRIAYWATASSFTSVSGSQDTMIGMRDVYLRVRKNSATSYDYWVSSDGVSWTSVLTAHNPGLVPTFIGFTALPPSGIALELSCHWFRMR
jgi:hypothetical protein